ncbi:MerR family transcriptional regulator [Gemmobacter nectariphilus]|uniref:MerR family transcriptional regulator n=1 Tax=Gemmobacter nectariphilus TaxID=220343 RepID=UPI00041F2AEA|nr:MerR family transcriptional regulator [Gemmobacter nectariphilus]
MAKSPEAFRTISEVADLLEVPAHVLRFWETRFPQIRPVKRAGGRRYYRPTDVALLSGIRILLHDQGMTIRGVQKILREQGVRHVCALADPGLETEAQEEWTQEASVPAAVPEEVRVIPWPGPRKTADAAADDAAAPQAGQSGVDEMSGPSGLPPDPQDGGEGDPVPAAPEPGPAVADDLVPDPQDGAPGPVLPHGAATEALSGDEPSWPLAPSEEPQVTDDLLPDPQDKDGAGERPAVVDGAEPLDDARGSAGDLSPAPSDDAPWPAAPPEVPPAIPDPQDTPPPGDDMGAFADNEPDIEAPWPEAPSDLPVVSDDLLPDPGVPPAPAQIRPDPFDGLPLFMQPAAKPRPSVPVPDLPEDPRHDMRALAARLRQVAQGDIAPAILRDLAARLHALRARMDQSHPER